MEIIWHLGVHRTGSTTLQNYLSQNRVTLDRVGISQWVPERTRSGLFTGLIHRPDALTASQVERGERAAGLIRIQTERLRATGFGQLIVSEENMVGSIRYNLNQSRLYPDLQARIERMRAAFCEPIRRIGLAIRSYDSYWSSAFSFVIQQGGALPDTDHLDRLVTQPRRWRDIVRAVSRAVPEAEIVVWPFETLGHAPDQAIALMSGKALPDLPSPDLWMNKSLRLPQMRRLLKDRGQGADADQLAQGEGRWMPFDPSQQAALRAQYREDLDWLEAGAEGLATYHSGRPSTTDTSAQFDTKKLDREVSGPKADAIAMALVRAIGGRIHGKQRHLA